MTTAPCYNNNQNCNFTLGFIKIVNGMEDFGNFLNINMTNIGTRMTEKSIKSLSIDDVVLIEDIRDLKMESLTKVDMLISLICLNGKGEAEIDNSRHSVSKNDMMIILPGSVLSNTMVSPDFEARIICLSMEIVMRLICSGKRIWHKPLFFAQNPVIRIGEEEVSLINKYYDLLYTRMRQPERHYSSDIIESLLRAAIYEIFTYMETLDISPDSVSDKRADELFSNFINLLRRCEVRPRNITFYSNHLCVSAKYLSSVCKSVSGKNASEWIKNYVTQDIIRLFKYSTLSIKEIAAYLDFPNISSFGKYVRKYLGESPTTCRRRLLNN